MLAQLEQVMKWFGSNWGAAICDETEHVETPVGGVCLGCQHDIRPDDQGFSLPLESDGLCVEFTAYHRECLLAALTGMHEP